MYPQISTVVAAQTQDALIERAARAQQARCARPSASSTPRLHHLPRVGSAWRHWLSTNEL